MRDMRMYDLINKKKYGQPLTEEEISFIVEGFTNGDIPDYQMAAFLMAVYFNGMSREETVLLTQAMADSGDRLDLSEIRGMKVDKHSTGGVGDKTSLILGPILASCGIPIAKMSGRGLGHTGGTIDKLESIPGFSTTLTEDKFIENVNTIGMALVGQTANLAPADKKLYALRDVTATVDSEPLIASSIMSKKLASGADVIVLDVKVGSGAFMQTPEAAESLGDTMVSIGTMAGKRMYAVITDMNEPLGCYVGNALEVLEAIEALKGKGEERLMEVTYELAACMLLAAGEADSLEEGRRLARRAVEDGSALSKFREFVKAQGGNPEITENYGLFKKAAMIEPVYPEKEGYLSYCRTTEVGMVSLILGGGRETKEDRIDHSVGIRLLKKLGDYVTREAPFAYLYGNDEQKMVQAMERLRAAYDICDEAPQRRPCVYVTKQGNREP